MKDKKSLLYFLILSTFLLSMMALLASADTGVKTSARSFALYNPDTHSFIFEKNADLRLPMASTTKIMTALIAIETLDPDEVIVVPEDAACVEGSSLYLKAGDTLIAENLIYGVMLQSANDAAAVIALTISGSIESFAEKMNARAAEIGAFNTKFENPHGLDSEGHYTTAKDLSLIAAEALKNETFRKIASTYKYSFNIGDKPRVIVNHNKLLKAYDGCIGVKTGFTKKSGRCLVSAAEKDGVTLVAVTLNDPDDWVDHTKALNLGFENLESVDLTSEIPTGIPTVSADNATLKIKLEKNNVIKRVDENISYSIDLPAYIASDVKAGETVGVLTVKIADREEYINIIAECDLKIKGLKKRLF